MVARLHVGQDAGKNSRCPAVKDEGVFRAVERCKLFPKDLDGLVESPAIEVAAVFILEKRLQLIDGIDPEIAGLYDGRRYGVEVAFPVFPEFVDDVGCVHFKIKYRIKKPIKSRRQ